jgi:integrase
MREIARDMPARARVGEDIQPKKESNEVEPAIVTIGEELERYLRGRVTDMRARSLLEIKRRAPGKSRERVLSFDELKAIWTATDGETDYGRIVRLLMLTGERREEIAATA